LDDTSDETSGPIPQPARSLYVAGAAACLAAFHGQTEKWTVADTRLHTIRRGELGCWEQEIYDFTAEMVSAHKADPSAIFQRTTTTTPSTCPQLLGINPSHGPRQGGYPVRITGENLPASLPLEFGDTRVTAVRDTSGALIVEVPAAGPDTAERVGVYPSDLPADIPDVATVEFLYDAEPTTSDEPTTSEEPTTDQPTTSDEPTTDEPTSSAEPTSS